MHIERIGAKHRRCQQVAGCVQHRNGCRVQAVGRACMGDHEFGKVAAALHLLALAIGAVPVHGAAIAKIEADRRGCPRTLPHHNAAFAGDDAGRCSPVIGRDGQFIHHFSGRVVNFDRVVLTRRQDRDFLRHRRHIPKLIRRRQRDVVGPALDELAAIVVPGPKEALPTRSNDSGLPILGCKGRAVDAEVRARTDQAGSAGSKGFDDLPSPVINRNAEVELDDDRLGRAGSG